MEIPKKIEKRGKVYNLVKEYPNFGLYEEEKTKFRRCFDKFDLGFIKEKVRPGAYINPEKNKLY